MTNHDEQTNILIVDDVPDKLLVYRTILDVLGLNLITASSGDEALKAVLQHDFAVILLDVHMPVGIDGFETAALIHRRKRSAHTPIIFLTAFADEVRVAEGYAQGAVDYITTPVIPDVLRAKVRVFAELHRMTQQVRRQAEERVALAEERSRREAVEEANRWLDFLTRAGGVLWQSLDQQMTSRSVVRLLIPQLADTAALITLTPKGAVERYLLARHTPEGPSIEENAHRESLEPELLEAVEKAIAEGNAQTIGDCARALPIRLRGQTFAILGIFRNASRRQFQPAELTVFETFASRATSALENSGLYRELQEANRQKNEFLSMLAHELRNPLAPIRNANEILRQKATDAAKVRWAQGVIDRQLTHLVRLVDDLLDVSRLTLGKIRLVCEPLPLENVITHAVEASQPLFDQFGHAVQVSTPAESVRVHGDESRLMQVFINLLNNAAKYTDPGGRISVSLAQENNTAVAKIRDTGIGIPADLLPSVFDLFTQSSRSLDRSQGGLGVGLTLVRQLIEMHGGTVEAFSEGIGCGSEFVIRLPALGGDVKKKQRAPHKANGKQLGGNSLKVLVVDDHIDGAASQADLLGLLGHQVMVAHDGPEALGLATEFHPDVVLLDIGLPGMDGYTVARRLHLKLQPTPVLVAISGYGREEDKQLSREAGFEYHFVKPVRLDALRELLDSIRVSHCA